MEANIPPKNTSIGVIGGGAWGTALAQVLAKGERDVTLWAREPEVVKSINEKRGKRDVFTIR